MGGNPQIEKAIARARLMRWATRGGVILFLLLTLLLLLPYGLRLGLERWLTSVGSGSVAVKNVDFNPFTGRLTLAEVYSKGKRGTLRCSRLVIHFDWWPLLQRQVRIDSIEAEDGVFDLDRHADGGWYAGGIFFPASLDRTNSHRTGEWTWSIDKVHLESIAVRYRDATGSVKMTIERGTFGGLDSQQPEAESPFALRLLSGGGSATLEGTAMPLAASRRMQANFRIVQIPVSHAAPFLAAYEIDPQAGELGGEGSVKAEVVSEDLKLFLAGKVQVQELRGILPEFKFSSENIAWEGESRLEPGAKWRVSGSLGGDLNLETAGLRIDADRIEVRGSFDGSPGTFEGDGAVNGLSIDQLGQEQRLLKLNAIDLTGLSISGEGKGEADEIRLTALGALEWPGEEGEAPFMLTLESGVLAKPRILGARRFDLGRVILDGFECRLERTTEGDFGKPSWFIAREKEVSGQVRDKEPLALLAEQAEISGGRVTFRDHSVSPEYREVMNIDEAHLKGLDTSDPKKETAVRLRAKVGPFASLEVNGVVAPKASRPTIDLDVRIKDLDLPSLNSYIERYLDYRVRSGHLDADLAWHALEGDLDSEARLRLVKLDASPLTGKGGGRLSKILGMPAEKAFSMLRDKDDTIRLKIPFKGDILDPHFNWDGIVVKAVQVAVQEAAMSYYAPLGITLLTGVVLPPGSIFLGGKIVDWARTMSFEPVKFLSLKTEPEAEGLNYLGKAADLLKGRPKARLVICGLATDIDLQAHRLNKGEGRKGKEAAPLAEESEVLLSLARNRALTVKETLVSLGIDAGRLLICTPELDMKEGATPRVELSI